MNGSHSKPDLPVEDDERHVGDVDAFIARNRKALNRSLRDARRDIAKGKTSDKGIDAIVAEGRARRNKKS